MMGFLQTGRALYVLAVICFGGIFVRLAAGSFYKKLIKESANMALTKNRYLRNLKQNAEDTYRINMGMNNAAVYLQRQLGNLKFLGFSLSGLENLAGQLTLLSFLAGGVTEKGVCDALNLAAVLEDGMRIMVPDKEQAAEWTQEGKSLADSPGVTAKGTPDQGAAGKVNLNRASVQELMTLSGIGQSRAEAIVRYREETGSFQTIEDVMKVSGIKENAFNKIKDNITV